MSINLGLTLLSLKKLGCVTQACGSAAELLENIESQTFDILLLERSLLDASNVKLLKKNARIIGLSAISSEEDRQLWQSAGADAVLVMPFTLDELGKILGVKAIENQKSKP